MNGKKAFVKRTKYWSTKKLMKEYRRLYDKLEVEHTGVWVDKQKLLIVESVLLERGWNINLDLAPTVTFFRFGDEGDKITV